MSTLRDLGCIDSLTDENLLLAIINIRNSRRQFKPRVEVKKKPTPAKSAKPVKEMSVDLLIQAMSPADRQSLIAKLTGEKK